jgi:hypothetical protein
METLTYLNAVFVDGEMPDTAGLNRVGLLRMRSWENYAFLEGH